MSKTPLFLRHLHVDRLYGRRHDGLRMDGLAPGINVVHGPNGQGKTTLGRGLHALVWPASVARHGPSLSGSFSLGDDEWQVELDGSAVTHQRGGVEAPAPPLAESDERDRYRLSLHDLLRSDGDGFARAVARDAAGGLDVPEATAALKFSASAPRSGNATRDAKAAWDALDAERRAQQELSHEANALDDLVARQAVAAAAQGQKELWDLAREHALSRDAAAAAAAELAVFPAALADTRDDDGDALRTLRDAARDAGQREHDAQRDADAAQAVLASNLASKAGRPIPLAELRTLHDTVRDADQTLAVKDSDLVGLRLQESVEADRFPADADLDRLFAATLADVGAVNDYAQKAAQLVGFQEEVAAFERVEKELPQTRLQGDLEAAAALLRDWLRVERSAPPASLLRMTLGAAVVLAVLAFVLGALVHPVGFALLLGAVALGVTWSRLRGHPDGRTAETQTRFERLRFGPVTWTRDGVETVLEAVERGRADAVLVAQVRARAAARRHALEGIDVFAAQVAAQGTALKARIGRSLQAEGLQLAYAVEGIRVYQQARSRREAAEAARSAAALRREGALAEATALLAHFGLPLVRDLASLSGALARLDEAGRAAEAAQAELKVARERAAEAARVGAETEAAVEALFRRLQLGPDDGDAAVDDACRRRAVYLAADRAASDARAKAEAALQRLRAHPAHTDEIEGVAAEDAASRRDDEAALARQAEPLTAEVAALRTRIGQAESAHAVEAAAAKHAAALGALQDERDRAVAARLGQLFADEAARASRELQVPAVVRRAGEILGGITAHRYGLTFDPVKAGFVATDHVLGRGLVLNELSSGTRVQLLLCVRVAFIEQHERGVRLPLILDELLANSDEARAGAITQAVVELCRQGRQVVYLTSQPEEVAKWRRVAEEHPDVPCAFFALGDGTGEPDPEARPHPSLAEPVPAPGDLAHAAYGALIGVSHWAAHENVGGLHLWYALDDPHTLHAVLSAGVSRLGPALAAVRSGVADALGLREVERTRLPVYADALAAWQAAWREGRGRPVLRDTIEASGAISGTFLDRVAGLAEEMGGDGRALLNALRSGGLVRFRSASADDLEVYLVDNGFVDHAAPLGPDAVWARVVARVGPTCAEGSSSLDDVRAFLGRVASGAPNAALQD